MSTHNEDWKVDTYSFYYKDLEGVSKKLPEDNSHFSSNQLDKSHRGPHVSTHLDEQLK